MAEQCGWACPALPDGYKTLIGKRGVKDQSAISMITARGTIGYIAPEVFSRNFGSISYKADMYRFVMMLLEMVGGRKTPSCWLMASDQKAACFWYSERGFIIGRRSGGRNKRGYRYDDFRYDQESYSLNFEEDGANREGELPFSSFAARLPVTPPSFVNLNLHLN
ncbi:Rust resistance kinase Lr10 [Linum grandiflorum]